MLKKNSSNHRLIYGVLALLVLYLIVAFYYQQKTIEKIIRLDFKTTTDKINLVITRNASDNDAIILSMADLISQNHFNFKAVNRNFKHIKSHFNLKPSIGAIVVADMNGNEFKVIRINNNNYVIRVVVAGQGVRKQEVYFSNFNNKLNLIGTDTLNNYEIHWGMFCENLQEPPINRIYQTEPYLLSYIDEFGLSNNLCVKDKDGEKMLIRLEFLLKNLNRFANSFKPSKNGVAVILDKNKNILGMSGLQVERIIHSDSAGYELDISLAPKGELVRKAISGNVIDWQSAAHSPQFTTLDTPQGKCFVEAWLAPKGQYSVMIMVPETDLIKDKPIINFLRISNYLIILLLTVITLYYLNSIKKQNRVIEEQNSIISAENKKIQTSINYARKVQTTFLAGPNQLFNMFENAGLIYRPRDLNGGDFYWTVKADLDFGETKETLNIVVVADCTGHGVPGALISIVGEGLLRNIVIDNKIYNPASILKEMDQRIKNVFKRMAGYFHDSIDLSIVLYNTGDSKLYYAGCNSAICVISGSDCREVKSSVFLPGLGDLKSNDEFELMEITLTDGMRVFMYTDGLLDQFGGPKGKKWGMRHFRTTLLETSSLPLDKQVKAIAKEIEEWKNGFEQTDDITLLAFTPGIAPPVYIIERKGEEYNRVWVARRDQTVVLSLGGKIGIEQFSRLVFETIRKSENKDVDSLIFDFKYLVGTDLEYFEKNFAFDARILQLLYSQKVAIIIPVDLFSRIALNRISQRYFLVDGARIRFFREVEDAHTWLEEEA